MLGVGVLLGTFIIEAMIDATLLCCNTGVVGTLTTVLGAGVLLDSFILEAVVDATL